MQHIKSALELPLPEKPQTKLEVFKSNSKLLFNCTNNDLTSELDRLSVSTYYEELDSLPINGTSQNFGITPLDDSDLLLDTSKLQSSESQDVDDNYEDVELLIQCLLEDETRYKLSEKTTQRKSPHGKNTSKTPVAFSPVSSGYISGPDSNRNSPLYNLAMKPSEQYPQKLPLMFNSEGKVIQRKFPKTSTRPWLPSADRLTLFKPSKVQKIDEKIPRRIKTSLHPVKNNKMMTTWSKLHYVPPTVRLSKGQTQLPYAAQSSLERYSPQQYSSDKQQMKPTGTWSNLGVCGRWTVNKKSPSALSGRIVWHETSL